MKKYLVKKHYEATKINNGFKGIVQDWYCGKGGFSFDATRPDYNTIFSIYGYNTKAAAGKALRKAQELAKCETEKGYWKVTCELVEKEID